MSKRLTSAIVLGLAVVAGPMDGSVWAQNSTRGPTGGAPMSSVVGPAVPVPVVGPAVPVPIAAVPDSTVDDVAASARIAADIKAAVQKAINDVIDAAPLVNGKKDTAAFAKLSAADKAAKINAAVMGVLAASGATPAVQVAALAAAVKSGVITAATAVSVAGAVSSQLSAMVRQNSDIQTALTDQGLTTASTTVNGQTVSVLTSLNTTQGAAGTPVTPATYDPCDGVVADYCSGV